MLPLLSRDSEKSPWRSSASAPETVDAPAAAPRTPFLCWTSYGGLGQIASCIIRDGRARFGFCMASSSAFSSRALLAVLASRQLGVLGLSAQVRDDGRLPGPADPATPASNPGARRNRGAFCWANGQIRAEGAARNYVDVHLREPGVMRPPALSSPPRPPSRLNCSPWV